ncbi:MAG: hypothetical protein EHJ94_03495 [Deltaproteobacteria bacterium]|nr:MAG: hypothetical protein EHJ94_03495 [Deltaproteobacteria bacterium]
MKIELWVIFQIVVDFILVVLILWLLKNMKFRLQQDISKDTSEKVMEMIEPLLTQANHTATTFGKQLKEKNHLINKLNEKLDSRIISLNLLLNRTESLLGKGNENSESQSIDVYDQQESIIQMYVAGKSPSEIAKTLSLPKGEVALVLDLKKKLLNIL